MMSIQAAWIGEHPHGGVSEGVALPPHRCFRLLESSPVSADSEHRDEPRRIPFHFGEKPAPAGDELSGTQLVGARGRACDQIGYAAAVLQELALLPRRKPPIGKARAVQCRPEAISRTGEVMTRSGRIEARID